MKVWVVSDEYYNEVACVCATKEKAYKVAREIICELLDKEETEDAFAALDASYHDNSAEIFFVTGLVSAEAMRVE